jgi:hypothetical protein
MVAPSYARRMDSTPLSSGANATILRRGRFIASLVIAGGVLAIGFFTGCMTENASYRVSAPPPPAPLGQQVAPMTPIAGGASKPGAFAPGASAETTIIVTQIPQFPQQEAMRAAPSYQYVWLAGYWTWRNDGYEWIAGHWEELPGTSSLWIRPYWTRSGGSYLFYEGHWN